MEASSSTSATTSATVRRSDRVCLTLLLEASGRDAEGHEFVEAARTMLISRHGGVIVLNRHLAAGQEVTLRRTLEAEAHRSATHAGDPQRWLADRRLAQRRADVQRRVR